MKQNLVKLMEAELAKAETALAVKVLAAGFAYYGIKPGDHIGFFVNNRFEWIPKRLDS